MNIATENVNNPMSNPEVAAKVAAANTGRACSATTKAKISAAITGTKRSKVTKAKMSAAMKGKNDKPVYIKWADGTETEIESLTEAISLIGVSSGLVSMWCNGSSTTYTKPKYGIAEIRYL